MKKPLIIFLIFSILTSNFVSFLIFVPKTKAIPVSIIASWPSELISKQLVHQAGQTFIEKVVVQLQKFILETLRKKLLDYFVDSIVRWIQGVDDKPAFVTNWRKFMGDVVNDAVGSYIETTKFAGLCDTFDFQVRVSLPQAGRPSLPTCTLNQIVNNIKSFYGNFGNGSWLAFNETLYPQGNAYGSYIMALEGEVYEVLAAELEKEKETSQSTGGFLNTKRCIEEKIDVDTGEKTCLEWQTTTPGQTVAGRIQQALDVDIENVLSATEFTTYVAAIADAAINRLFKAGTDGLLGILTKEAPEKLGDGPTNINYECDTDLGACIMKVDGKFISKEECDIDCAEKSGVKWACEENSKKCMISPYGKYSSEADCVNKCSLGGGDCNTEPELCSEINVYVRGQKCDGLLSNCAVVGTSNTNPTCCDIFCSHMKDIMYPKETAKHSWDWSDADDNGIISTICKYAGVPVQSSCSCSINNMGGACFTGIPKSQCGNPIKGSEYDLGLLICKGEPPYCVSANFEEEVASCVDCTGFNSNGMYVRGRMGGNDQSECPDGICPRCSGTRYTNSRNGVCDAFCLHTKEFLWGKEGLPSEKLFTKEEIIYKGFELLFTHLGESIPNEGCYCERPLTNSTFADGYNCYDCVPVQGKNLEGNERKTV